MQGKYLDVLYIYIIHMCVLHVPSKKPGND